MNQCLNIKFKDQFIWDWYLSTSRLGAIYPLEDYCVISEKPEEIHMRKGLLHNEDGMSVKYADGFGCYSLNGIPMKEEYILTTKDKITTKMVLSEENIDQRRELIRKVGLERLALEGKIVHQMGDYKLVDMGKILTLREYAPYLLMKNPSLDNTWHMEGVSRDCKTVDQALHYRKPEAMKRIPVSDILGEDWFQQGDVCMWNREAIMLKTYPKIIT